MTVYHVLHIDARYMYLCVCVCVYVRTVRVRNCLPDLNFRFLNYT